MRRNGEACRASSTCFWNSLINLISKDTYMVFYLFCIMRSDKQTLYCPYLLTSRYATKIIYSCVTVTCTNKKITCYDHIIQAVKINILTGHEEIDILHFILNTSFHCIFIEKHAFSQNLCS